MAAKQDRLRADIWSTLRPHIEAEMARTGLSAQEVINIALAGYFGLTPKGISKENTSNTASVKPSQQVSTTVEDEDYI